MRAGETRPLPEDWKLSVVIPAYNEKNTIRAVVEKVLGTPYRKEIIVVDDGSDDGTREELQSLESETSVRLIYKDRNRGKGAALR